MSRARSAVVRITAAAPSGLLAAVEEVEGLGDPPGGMIVFHGQRAPVHDGSGIGLRVLVGGQRNGAELLLLGTELVHVALGLHGRQGLPRGHAAEGGLVGIATRDLGGAGGQGLPEPAKLALGQASIGDNVLGVAGHNRCGGIAYSSRPAASTTAPVHVAEAHFGGTQGRRYAHGFIPVAGIGSEPVDLPWVYAGVLSRGQDGLQHQVELSIGLWALL